ncbi:YfiH family protein [Trueperella bonasi]|uniref:YfiH family protein n=1 Tax=Trueperella bonasi TaxID=312286 RepID=A0ABT9NHZ1_9ACTO|nr:polyphenol oxidase family protein [Trueperella bonasi]MDP9807020.1 YfiH family protein [Trueperella bonasi]
MDEGTTNTPRTSGLVDWIDPSLLPRGVKVGFTSNVGGASTGDHASFNLGFHVGDDPGAVSANRGLLQREIGVELTWMSQVHGKTIARASEASRGELGYLSVGEADAVVVETGQAAAVMVADCVPLIVVTDDGKRGAAVHVGRAGFDLGIAHAVLDALGTVDVVAFLGPSIAGRCYEVGEELATQFDSRWPGTAVTTRWGTPGLDIAGGLERQLQACGVTNIHRSPVCTYASPAHYSHRRATHEGRKTGRFVGLVHIG